jgi:hypothetical protein
MHTALKELQVLLVFQNLKTFWIKPRNNLLAQNFVNFERLFCLDRLNPIVKKPLLPIINKSLPPTHQLQESWRNFNMICAYLFS